MSCRGSVLYNSRENAILRRGKPWPVDQLGYCRDYALGRKTTGGDTTGFLSRISAARLGKAARYAEMLRRRASSIIVKRCPRIY